MSRKIFRCILSVVVAGFFMAASTTFAQSNGGGKSGNAHKKAENDYHQGDMLFQRQRMKESRKSVRSETRLYEHAKPPKAPKHKLAKTQRHQTPKLRRANKKAHHH